MTHRAAEDVDLIARYLRGDTTAFDELMRAHEDWLMRKRMMKTAAGIAVQSSSNPALPCE